MKTNRPIRVLQVVGTLSVGGAETWLLELLRHWSRSGAVEMDFLLTSGAPGVLDETFSSLGAKIHHVRYVRGHLREFARTFHRILREGAYDAIHDHSDYASGWHFLFGFGVLPPVRIAHIHSAWRQFRINYTVSLSRRVSAALGQILVRRLATNVCGTSAQSLRDYGFEPDGAGRPKVSVLPCGFDIATFAGPREADRASVVREFGLEPDTKLIFHAGRLDRQLEIGHPQNQKNSWLVVEIAREALKRDPSVALLMAGSGGGQRAELEQRIAAWGLEGRLRHIGIRSDIARLMRAADIVLFPSADEGLGMVAVEAQAAGCPVLASNAVPREACINPELYHSLDLSEPPAVWARALLRIVAAQKPTPEECRVIAERSPFSIETSARNAEAIYKSGRA